MNGSNSRLERGWTHITYQRPNDIQETETMKVREKKRVGQTFKERHWKETKLVKGPVQSKFCSC